MIFVNSRFAITILGVSSLLFIAGCQKKQKSVESSSVKFEQYDSPTDFTGGMFEIVSPREDEVVQDRIEVYFASTGLEISEDANHYHFILDDGEIIEHYDAKSPLVIDGLADGTHIIRAFVVGTDHVSVKSAETYDMVRFFVNEKTDLLIINKSEPMLFLNIPSGRYEAKYRDNIIFDFWVTNAQIGIYDYNVKYSLDGHEETLSLWKSFVISGLSEGKHKLIIDLIDPNGKPVLGNLNHSVRTFIVER